MFSITRTSNINLIVFGLPFLILINGFKADNSACDLVDCGQGTCKPSNTTLFVPYECECFPGWKKIQVGPATLPACILPDCTLNFSCGGNAPPPPPPPPLLPSLPNLTDPCFLSWCGEGTCVANGTNHICKCNEGSANLFNSTAMACFKECTFGADCNGLVFGPQSPPPPSGLAPPPSANTASSSKGLLGQVLSILLLAAAVYSFLDEL
ncbi:hypothetical protein Sjap_019094 [Stephania japonica]|uniref:EGF-like domain-containing protein n=1 Tax=Stephania japonica TaxID=461633 RepID=A0AAP0F0X0_9MAGN